MTTSQRPGATIAGPTHPSELELGDRVSVAGHPIGGRPVAVVLNVNTTTITVVLEYDLARGNVTKFYAAHGTYRLAWRAAESVGTRRELELGLLLEPELPGFEPELTVPPLALELPFPEPELDPAPIVIIPCSAGKLDRPAPAAELYTGSYHRAARRAAERLTRPDRIFILSARHGIIRLADPYVIAPYETTFGDPDAIGGLDWRYVVAELEAGAAGVIVLAGSRYAERVLERFPDAELPLAGGRGIGDHLATLKRIAA